MALRVRTRQGNRRSLSEGGVLALQRRRLRLPTTAGSPSQLGGSPFPVPVVPSSCSFPSACQPNCHSIPIVHGPAQFNGLYLNGSGRNGSSCSSLLRRSPPDTMLFVITSYAPVVAPSTLLSL